ncbi:MAG: lipid-A-disaccharide synthase [Geminicoccaceae bacterium]
MNAAKRLILVAGEPSGDRLGAELVRALRRRCDFNLSFFGVAGAAMQAEGVSSAFAIEDLSIMGFLDVPRALPRLAARLHGLARESADWRPHAIVTIDSPEFSLRIQRRLEVLGCPRIHYVAPKAWAWRPGRARHLARDVDMVLALFPFEPDFFASYCVRCDFVGHPALDRARRTIGSGWDNDHRPCICILPGSRRSEVSRHLPAMIEACEALRTRVPDLLVAVPTVDAVVDEVRKRVPADERHYRLVSDPETRWAVFRAARMAIAKLGTISLELAFANCPFVSIYRTDPVSAAVARRLVRSRFLALPNILLDEPLVPEIVQGDLNRQTLEKAVLDLWFDDQRRTRQRDGFERLRDIMDPGDGRTASERAADSILSLL